MIKDILDYENDAVLEADVAVAGSGIAGSEVALYLARRGMRVILLESGREAFDSRIQALNDVEFAAKRHRDRDPDAPYHHYLPPELRGVSRLRQLGGTSNVWTGKWKYLQSSDFEARPWVPDSDWPIRFGDLVGFYRAVCTDYGFGDLEAEAARPAIAEIRQSLEPAGLKLSSFWWEKSPLRTRLRFSEEMRGLSNLSVILGATVTDLAMNAARRAVTSVECRALEGRRIRVRASRFVLATGGLETPRLLLSADREVAGGIGNGNDLVGRYYTDHLKHHSGRLNPGPLARRIARELQYAPKPRFCLCFALDDETQRRHRLLEHVVYLKPIYESWRERARRALARTPACRDGLGSVRSYRVKLVSEQVPTLSSRVRLGESRDVLGMRKLVVDWRFTHQDHESLAKIVALAARSFRKAGLGEFEFGALPPSVDNMTDAAHQMGTTRMAERPERGVCDPDCRVFGTDNLYIAGSAVFPTGPSYSPTLTILALSRRLAEHIFRAEAARPHEISGLALSLRRVT